MPALIEILGNQQAETSYPFQWPMAGPVEHFLQRPTELQAWVAVLEGRIVGHVALQAVGDDELGQMWATAHGSALSQLRCISVLYADRRFPRRGIGSTLLATATREALELGGAPVLDVVATHYDAVRLYLRHGWQEIGRFRPPWLPAPEQPVRVMILPRPAGPAAPGVR